MSTKWLYTKSYEYLFYIIENINIYVKPEKNYLFDYIRDQKMSSLSHTEMQMLLIESRFHSGTTFSD